VYQKVLTTPIPNEPELIAEEGEDGRVGIEYTGQVVVGMVGAVKRLPFGIRRA